MKLVYKTVITEIGQYAKDLLGHNMFITFKVNAPKELKDYCFIHDMNKLYMDIRKNDLLKIADREYKITAVGSIVNENLRLLGHITYKFNGSSEADIAGTLFLEIGELPSIGVGTIIEIVRA